MRDLLRRWIEEHQALSWGQFLIAAAAFLTSPAVGLESITGAAMLVGGGFIAGVLGTVLVNTPSTRQRVECVGHVWKLRVKGGHGSRVTSEERSIFLANGDVTAFVFQMRYADGALQDVTRFRKWERTVEPPADLQYIELREGENLFQIPDPGGTTAITVIPPKKVRKGDRMELVTESTGTDCFPRDTEYVSKVILYPSTNVKFELTFEGCQVSNCVGRRFHARLPVDTEALAPRNDKAGEATFGWSVSSAAEGDDCRVQWRWA